MMWYSFSFVSLNWAVLTLAYWADWPYPDPRISNAASAASTPGTPEAAKNHVYFNKHLRILLNSGMFLTVQWVAAGELVCKLTDDHRL
jgi:hypothetical protein